MFLLEPGETAFDLKWRMFGVGVRVHPMFWLVGAIMGFSWLNIPDNGTQLFLLWMACFFGSILIHELGHVFMFRMCGAEANVVLYAFGGLAIPDRHIYNPWKRIAVSLAGPFAQFLILAVVGALLAVKDPELLETLGALVLHIFGIETRRAGPIDFSSLATVTVLFLIEINLFWALLNLLPIYPLDGGQVSRDFLGRVVPDGRGGRMALGISLLLAGVLTVHCIMAANGRPLLPFLPGFGTYSALFFGMLAVQSYQMLQYESDQRWRREG
jgi:Zn-dependent protease